MGILKRFLTFFVLLLISSW